MVTSDTDTADIEQQLLVLQQEVAELRKKNADLAHRLSAYSQINSGQVTLINNLVEKVPFGVMLLDKNRKIIHANVAAGKIMGMSPDQMVGQHCRNYFKCSDFDTDCPVLDTGSDIDLQQIRCTHNDKYILHSAFKSDEGSEEIVVETFIDITEIKNAEKELLKIAKIKDEFLGILSHELRTPLNAIQGYSSLLEEDIKDTKTENSTFYIEKIKDAGNLLLKVVNGLLELSDLTAGKLKTDYIPIDMQMIISQIQYRFNDEFLVNGNKLIIEADEIAPFEQDLLMIMKVLYELLDNANKFTDDGEIKLAISLQRFGNDDNPWLSFKVTDSGCGMTEETIEFIFNAFHQADSSLTRSYEGLGLGLSIVEKIVKLINGQIEVKSHFGVGSTFTVLLPYKKVVSS